MKIEDKRNKPEEVWLNKIKDGDMFECNSDILYNLDVIDEVTLVRAKVVIEE